MIRLIATIDLMRGIADDNGIPWNLPGNHEYYVKKVSKGRVLMGYNTYLAHSATLHSKIEYVATSRSEPLREGFECVEYIEPFLAENTLTWVLGGSALFKSAIEFADELYITQVNGDFKCTKFFPKFEDRFYLVKRSVIKKENGTEFQYQIWKNKKFLMAAQLD